jgi:Pyridoxamine 5'-phosphate oxidase
MPWDDVLAAIDRAEIFWPSTVRADGRPHVTPLPAMWLDGLALGRGDSYSQTRYRFS